MIPNSILRETDITNAIRDLLLRVGAFPLKIWGNPMMMRGISDLIACYRSKYVAIEVKRPGNKTTPDQDKFLENVRRAGGIAFVAYSVDDVIRELDLDIELHPLFRRTK